MSYLEKIAGMLEEAEGNAFDTMVEDAHVKIAMLDDVAEGLSEAANHYDSEELMKVAEVIDAMVVTEVAEVDDTLNKIAEMAEAGPATVGLIEKRAGNEFETNVSDEAERIQLLDEISDFVKEAAIEAEDESLFTIGEAVGDIAESDAQVLEEIAKEAGFSWKGISQWMGSAAKAKDLRVAARRLKGMKGTQLKFVNAASRKKALAREAKNLRKTRSKIRSIKGLASGMAGKATVKANRKLLRGNLMAGAKGAGKTGFLYTAPAAILGGTGYGAYRLGKDNR